MFHNTGQVLRLGELSKRAIGRNRFTSAYNFKDRIFILKEKTLAYFEGTEEKVGREKGSLELSLVKAIEKVDFEAFSRNHGFQIVFEDFVLYMFAKDERLRDDWISSLRDVISTKDNSLYQSYHPGAFINNIWTCCKEKIKHSPGCQNSHYNQSTTHVTDEPNGHPPRPSVRETFKVTAKYNFEPAEETDLGLVQHEEYTIIDTSQGTWWLARDELGREGYVPSNYVKRHVGIESEIWYQGDMTRQEADIALKDDKPDGTYLVRNSSQQEMYTLSFCFQKVVKHYHIRSSREGKYYVSQRHNFDSVSQLIAYHKLNSAGLVTRLRLPYTGTNAPPVMLGYGVFQINRSELCIKKEIGTGQFGAVYEATWRKDKKVAVKMMKPGTMSVHDFIEEAKVMHKLQHKNLVSIHGICSEMDPLYIVVEYMCNGSLLQYLRDNRHLHRKANILTDIVLQVACAMQYLEKEKFIHRDLAARNCLVGENYHVKVGDFGLARYVLDDQYTASEGTKFPVKWAAPEVIDFTKFSSKSDVWAYGILCWEVFSGGKSPYRAFTNPQVAEEVRNGYRMERPEYCSPDIYSDLVLPCWNQAPEGRPSFSEIYITLKNITEDYADT